ncbi:MAG: mechanosensitive ion channel family protein, partial [Pseudomonadota bacterium]|nr:mechanosensitive ion channel family protein [Pseudomonadota bacterium]
NKQIIIANNTIMSGNIVNYSALPERRVDMVVGVSYDADLSLVKKTLQELVDADERILKDPACTIAVAELADSSVNLVLRPWVKSADFWGVKFDLTEAIKVKFDELGIGIPYPQMDLHVNQVA